MNFISMPQNAINISVLKALWFVQSSSSSNSGQTWFGALYSLLSRTICFVCFRCRKLTCEWRANLSHFTSRNATLLTSWSGFLQILQAGLRYWLCTKWDWTCHETLSIFLWTLYSGFMIKGRKLELYACALSLVFFR